MINVRLHNAKHDFIYYLTQTRLHDLSQGRVRPKKALIGTLGHYIGTCDIGQWDIGTLGHGTFYSTLFLATPHTHHTHTHAHVQPSTHVHNHSQTPLPYGVCWRLALLSLQCVRTAPPPSGPCGVWVVCSGWSAPNVCPSHPHCTLSPVPPSTGHLLLPSTLRTTTPRATMLVAAAPSS